VYHGLKEQDVCTNCRYRFSREYGYFLGALIVTYAVLGGIAFVAMRILVTAGASIWIALGLPLLIGFLVLPIFIPLSHTLWMAIDLRFSPPEPEDFDPKVVESSQTPSGDSTSN